MTREEIIAAAIVIHDDTGCRCDRKYLMSCAHMVTAILSLAKRDDQHVVGDVDGGEDTKSVHSDIL